MLSRLRGIALAVALLFTPLVLTACNTIPSTHIGQTTTLDEKALWAAEAIYNVPAQAYVTADQNGTLPASVKATARPLLVQAYQALQAARTAYAASDAATFGAQIAAAEQFASQAKALIVH